MGELVPINAEFRYESRECALLIPELVVTVVGQVAENSVEQKVAVDGSIAEEEP